MKKQLRMTGLLLAVVVILASGCTNYVVTRGLEHTLLPSQSVFIGEIRDQLPAEMDPGKKPSLEDMQKFRTYLADEFSKQDLFGAGDLNDSIASRYKVTGAMLDYKKGSGFLRAIFGAWLGAAEVTVQLELHEINTGDMLFSGNFKGSVTDYKEAGDKMFKRVSKDFVKAISKQNKKLVKKAAADQSADISN